MIISFWACLLSSPPSILSSGYGEQLTDLAEARRCCILVPAYDLPLGSRHVDDAIVAELDEGARVVACSAGHVETDVLAVRIATQIVTTVDKGGAQHVRVGRFRGEGPRVG